MVWILVLGRGLLPLKEPASKAGGRKPLADAPAGKAGDAGRRRAAGGAKAPKDKRR
jgi:hypothetical protein